jgi:hypothetical protein
MADKWFEKPVRMIRWDLLGEYERIKDVDLKSWARDVKEKWHSNCEWAIGVPGQAPRVQTTLIVYGPAASPHTLCSHCGGTHPCSTIGGSQRCQEEQISPNR